MAGCTCWKKYTLTVSSGKASAFVSMCTSDTEIAPSCGSTFTHMQLHITIWLVLFILLTIFYAATNALICCIHATCATLFKSRYDCVLPLPKYAVGHQAENLSRYTTNPGNGYLIGETLPIHACIKL